MYILPLIIYVFAKLVNPAMPHLGFWDSTVCGRGVGIYCLGSATLRCQDTVGIMPCRLSMLDETVETRLPWLDFSLPRRPCRVISVFHGHNSTVSRQLHYSLSRDSISPHRARKPHISPQRKGRKHRGRHVHVLLRERIAKLPSVCRIMLRTTEMHRHGRRGKALCATDGA